METHQHLRHAFSLLEEDDGVLVSTRTLVHAASCYHELAHAHP